MLVQRVGTLLTSAILLFAAVASAQTTSITINGAPGTMSTGAFAGLQALDQNNNPVLATWSSSNPSAISVSSNGVATAVSGTVSPVTITATLGSLQATATINAVYPQTTLFAADGSNLSVYDITLRQKPSLVTTVTYYTQLGGGNGQSPIPMALGPGSNSTEQYLFIANPAYLSSNSNDFVVIAIDTTNYSVVGEITGLCYPTSLAVASHFLYVVNAGPSVAQGTAATTGGCASSTPANVQYYDINQIAKSGWVPVDQFAPGDLAGSTGISNAIPLVVAASADQTDSSVYIGSTESYKSNAAGSTGLLSQVATGVTHVTGLTNAWSLASGSGTTANSILPLALTVVTAYPQNWGNPPTGPVHTAFILGNGFTPSVSNGTFFAYISDNCDTSLVQYQNGCPTQPSAPGLIFSGTGGPGSYSPWELAKSPDGLTVYAGDDNWYLDQITSADGTSTTGFSFSQTFFTTNGTNVDCTQAPCSPITGIAANADESNAFVSFTGSSGQIDRLNPSSFASDNTISNVSPLSLIVTQHPEIQLSISQTGTTVSGSFVVHGNYQNNFGNLAFGYPFSCDWGEDNFNSGNFWSNNSVSIGPTGGTVFPNPPTYQSGSTAAVSIIPSAAADANGLSGTIINPVPVGPITVQIAAATTSVPLGATDQFSWLVNNATDQSVVWQVNTCTAGDQTCPWGFVSITPPENGLYSAPGVLPSGSPQVVAISNADATIKSNPVTLTLTTPTANISPNSLTFAAQNVGTTSSAQTVTVTNTGQANLILGNTPLSFTGNDPSDFATASGTTCTANLSIAPNGNCVVQVTFTPSTSGMLTANLVITDNSGGTSGTTQTVTLTGTGQQLVPTASVSPSSLTFSAQNVGTTSTAQTVTVTNTGQANLILGNTPLSFTGSDPSDFATASGTTCTANLSIAPNGNCVVQVTFTPSTSGTLTANLVITDNSGGTSGATQTVTLTGTGQQLIPTASVSPSSLTFSAQNVGTTSASQKVTVTNTGTASLVLAATPLSFSGSNSGDFATTSGTTCTANLSIAPNASCVVQVAFTPTSSGTRSANLVITDNSGGTSGATQTVSLSGTGQNPGTGTASISPSSLTFAAQNVGTTSNAQTVTVTNTGTANLILGNTPLSFTGSAPSDFATASGTTCTANLSIAPNGNCVVQVTFTPSTSGTLTANLVITDNSGGTSGATQTVTLTGTGQQLVPTASVSPSSLTFAAQNIGTTSSAKAITVTNSGTANLVLAAAPISITGSNSADFATASGTTCTANLSIVPSASCTIEVTFTPAAAGTRTASLVITDNSGGTNGSTQTVSLTGSGQQATGTASVSPSTLTFGTQNVGTTSAAKTVTVTNTGQGNLVLASPAVSLTGAVSDYGIASGTTCTSNLSIAPNSSCVIQVTFSPLAAGVLTATLVITDNSGGTAGATQSVSLSGTGFQPTTLSIFPANPAVEVGQSQQFTPNFTPANAAGPVNWSVSGTGCGGQACGSIDANGLYTVPPTVAAEAVDTVTATLASNSSVTGSTEINVFLAPVLATTGGSQTVAAGQTATYNLTLSAGTGDTASPLTVECHQNTLPTGVNCPQVLVQPSNSAVAFTFSVNTTARQSAAALQSHWFGANLALLLPGLLFMTFSSKAKRAVRNRGRFVVPGIVVVLLCLMTLCACGTNGSFGQVTQKNFGGTPSGTYSIQIDGVGPSNLPEKIGTVSLTVE